MCECCISRDLPSLLPLVCAGPPRLHYGCAPLAAVAFSGQLLFHGKKCIEFSIGNTLSHVAWSFFVLLFLRSRVDRGSTPSEDLGLEVQCKGFPAAATRAAWNGRHRVFLLFHYELLPRSYLVPGKKAFDSFEATLIRAAAP